MRLPKISDSIKKVTELLPKKDIEKIILKTLFVLWVVAALATSGLRMVKNSDDAIEKRISETATKMPLSPSVGSDEIKKYEGLLNMAQYPEPMSEYGQKLRRDPFSKYVEEVIGIAVSPTAHDFSLKSIGNVPLPVIYRGFIELPDKIIGQINWKDATRFVEKGATLNGYKILAVNKNKIEAVDEEGRKWDFFINKAVLSDKLNAVLYDKISKKSYTVEIASVIDDYKVIDIQPDCVILLSKGEKITLTKQQ